MCMGVCISNSTVLSLQTPPLPPHLSPAQLAQVLQPDSLDGLVQSLAETKRMGTQAAALNLQALAAIWCVWWSGSRSRRGGRIGSASECLAPCTGRTDLVGATERCVPQKPLPCPTWMSASLSPSLQPVHRLEVQALRPAHSGLCAGASGRRGRGRGGAARAGAACTLRGLCMPAEQRLRGRARLRHRSACRPACLLPAHLTGFFPPIVGGRSVRSWPSACPPPLPDTGDGGGGVQV